MGKRGKNIPPAIQIHLLQTYLIMAFGSGSNDIETEQEEKQI